MPYEWALFLELGGNASRGGLIEQQKKGSHFGLIPVK